MHGPRRFLGATSLLTGQAAFVTAVVVDCVLRNPSSAELAKVIGLPAPKPSDDVYDLLIVGAGPAGLAAAVYGASEGLRTIVLANTATGGQAGLSTRIENYLGFPAVLSGARSSSHRARRPSTWWCAAPTSERTCRGI